MLKLLFITACIGFGAQAAYAQPSEIDAILKTTEGYKHESKQGIQSAAVFHQRKAGNCIDFTMYWLDEAEKLGIADAEAVTTVNPDGSSHMTLVLYGRYKLSAEPAGQFVYDMRYNGYMFNPKAERWVLVTPNARITKATQSICERDAASLARRHTVRCEKAGL